MKHPVRLLDILDKIEYKDRWEFVVAGTEGTTEVWLWITYPCDTDDKLEAKTHRVCLPENLLEVGADHEIIFWIMAEVRNVELHLMNTALLYKGEPVSHCPVVYGCCSPGRITSANRR